MQKVVLGPSARIFLTLLISRRYLLVIVVIYWGTSNVAFHKSLTLKVCHKDIHFDALSFLFFLFLFLFCFVLFFLLVCYARLPYNPPDFPRSDRVKRKPQYACPYVFFFDQLNKPRKRCFLEEI